MKIEININDFYFDQENELEPALKDYIIRECVNQISQNIREKVDQHVKTKVSDMVEKYYGTLIQDTIKTIIDTERVSYGREEATLADHIRKQINANSGWNSPREQLEKIAKAHADEIKKRYDLMFATQIVAKLGQNGMLKEDIAQLILTEQKP
jgi:hypothetical protein